MVYEGKVEKQAIFSTKTIQVENNSIQTKTTKPSTKTGSTKQKSAACFSLYRARPIKTSTDIQNNEGKNGKDVTLATTVDTASEIGHKASSGINWRKSVYGGQFAIKG